VIAGALAGIVFGVVGETIGWTIGYAILDGRGITIVLSSSDVLLLALGGLAGVALWGAIGTALGAIIHNQVGTIITLLAWGFVINTLLIGLAPAVGRFMPTHASDAMMGLRGHHHTIARRRRRHPDRLGRRSRRRRRRHNCAARHQLTPRSVDLSSGDPGVCGQALLDWLWSGPISLARAWRSRW
jgi:hypothetical protein